MAQVWWTERVSHHRERRGSPAQPPGHRPTFQAPGTHRRERADDERARSNWQIQGPFRLQPAEVPGRQRRRGSRRRGRPVVAVPRGRLQHDHHERERPPGHVVRRVGHVGERRRSKASPRRTAVNAGSPRATSRSRPPSAVPHRHLPDGLVRRAGCPQDRLDHAVDSLPGTSRSRTATTTSASSTAATGSSRPPGTCLPTPSPACTSPTSSRIDDPGVTNRLRVRRPQRRSAGRHHLPDLRHHLPGVQRLGWQQPLQRHLGLRPGRQGQLQPTAAARRHREHLPLRRAAAAPLARAQRLRRRLLRRRRRARDRRQPPEQPKIFLSQGHDEYWSGPAARPRRGGPRQRREPASS